jgi:hypothetical protein
MFYCYNSSIYFRGRANVPSQINSCIDNDIISLIIDTVNNTLSFRKNGIQVSDMIELVKIEDLNQQIKFVVDFCDQNDEVMFLY